MTPGEKADAILCRHLTPSQLNEWRRERGVTLDDCTRLEARPFLIPRGTAPHPVGTGIVRLIWHSKYDINSQCYSVYVDPPRVAQLRAQFLPVTEEDYVPLADAMLAMLLTWRHARSRLSRRYPSL